MKDILEFMRGVVRPAVTLGAVAATVAMLFIGLDIPDWWQVMLASIVAFWFAQRTAKKGE